MNDAYKVAFEKTVDGHVLKGVGELRSLEGSLNIDGRKVLLQRLSLELIVAIVPDNRVELTGPERVAD